MKFHDLVPIPAGSLVLRSSGSYSDYGVWAAFITKAEIDLEALWSEINPETDEQFFVELARRELIQEQYFWELHSDSDWDSGKYTPSYSLEKRSGE